MKKFALAGIVIAGSLALGGCAGGGSISDFDLDMNNRSAYNDRTYCGGDTYIPLPNNQYECEDRDTKKRKVTATKRPTPVIPPKVATPAKPAVPAKPAAPAPKPAAPAPKPAPAPKAPAPKTK